MKHSNIHSKSRNRFTGNRFLLVTIIGTLLSWGSFATAGPVTYEEVFGKNLKVREGQRAIYNFDLGQLGGRSLVRAPGGAVVGPIRRPTVDETDFDGTHSITSAVLSFEIGGMDWRDPTNSDERLKIKVTGESGTGAVLFNDTAFLGIQTFDFNLTGTQLDWLNDGKLRTVAVAIVSPGFDNDFQIREASLVVKARATHVPEPASLALFGLGLFGLAFYRRKLS